MEDKKKIVEALRARALENIQTGRGPDSSYRGINSKTKGADTRIINGVTLSIEAYRLDKFLSRLYLDKDCICVQSANSNGYRNIYLRAINQNYLAHRFVYEFYIGIIPHGLVIDHICRNRSCVNPEHLRVVSHRENILCGSGATAKHAKKTHCIRGHEFTVENTYISKFGRSCRVCKAVSRRNHFLANREKELNRSREYKDRIRNNK